MSTKEAWEDVGMGGAKHPQFGSAAPSSAGLLGGQPASSSVLELVQQESQQHYLDHKRLLHPLSTGSIGHDAESLGDLWDAIGHHLELARRTIELAREALAANEGDPEMLAQAYLIEEYLLRDEELYDVILAKLDEIKAGM